MKKSAVTFAALILALAASMFVNFGSYSASAQQQAVASATPICSANPQETGGVQYGYPAERKEKIGIPILVHGTGPNDGDQFLLKSADGTPITREATVQPAWWTGWGVTRILDFSFAGTGVLPENAGGYKVLDPAGNRLYAPRAVEIRGHGAQAEIRTKVECKDCGRQKIWDFTVWTGFNFPTAGTVPNVVEIFAEVLGDNGQLEEKIIATEILDHSGIIIDPATLYPGVMVYTHRGAIPGSMVKPGEFILATRPYFNADIVHRSLTFSIPMQGMTPIQGCIWIGARLKNITGYGVTRFAFMDLVEIRDKSGEWRDGEGLYYGGTGKYPVEPVCGSDKCVAGTPAGKSKSVEYLTPQEWLKEFTLHPQTRKNLGAVVDVVTETGWRQVQTRKMDGSVSEDLKMVLRGEYADNQIQRNNALYVAVQLSWTNGSGGSGSPAYFDLMWSILYYQSLPFHNYYGTVGGHNVEPGTMLSMYKTFMQESGHYTQRDQQELEYILKLFFGPQS